MYVKVVWSLRKLDDTTQVKGDCFNILNFVQNLNISKTVLNIWKFRFLLNNLKSQKFKTFWIVEILTKNLKTQNDFKNLTF